jgi:hypothetical protein
MVSISTLQTTVLQFADDTAIITPAHTMNLKIIKQTLEIFENISGLRVNTNKSGFIPIAVAPHHAHTIASITQFLQISFPTTYLGLPLTICKPPREAYLPLISIVQHRFEGWAGKHLSPVERNVLT